MVYLFVLEISLPKEISIFCELEIDLTVELIAVLKSSNFSLLFCTYRDTFTEDSGKSSPKHLW